MRAWLITFAAIVVVGAAPPKPPTPNDIVASAPPSAWKTINPDNLLVIDLKSGGATASTSALLRTPPRRAGSWR